MGDIATARRALALLDLTNLNEECDAAAIDALCARAQGRYGKVAAVCVWPRFVAQAKKALGSSGVKVATVANFPGGDQGLKSARDQARRAIDEGADEIDVVIPYRKLGSDPEGVQDFVAAMADEAGGATLKTILETGELEDDKHITLAANLALLGGTDFLKTSTGKVKTNATPHSARLLLECLAEADGPAGFKAAGGVRTLEDAANYLALADEIMGPGWARAETFRFGASGLLDALEAALSGQQEAAAGDEY